MFGLYYNDFKGIIINYFYMNEKQLLFSEARKLNDKDKA
jgi:hypothetical protein